MCWGHMANHVLVTYDSLPQKSEKAKQLKLINPEQQVLRGAKKIPGFNCDVHSFVQKDRRGTRGHKRKEVHNPIWRSKMLSAPHASFGVYTNPRKKNGSRSPMLNMKFLFRFC